MKVSVIIPVYNAEKYLKRCLESMMNQTLQDIEIICIDDCSSDNSCKILLEYKHKDSRIKVCTHERNMGAGMSRNEGMKLAQGKYIQFVDADDYMDEEALERLYKKAEQYQSDMCFLKMQLHRETENIGGSVPPGITGVYKGSYEGKKLFSLFLERDEFFLYSCLVFYRKGFLECNHLEYKALKIGEGGELILQALYRAAVVIVDNGHYYHYCINASSVTHQEEKGLLSLLGQITQLIEMIGVMANERNEAVLKTFIEKQYRKVHGGIDGLSREEIEYIYRSLKDDFSRGIFRLLSFKQTYVSDFSSHELDRIKNAKEVLIYGAGYASTDIIDLLNKHRINILGFAVSSLKGNPVSLYGHHVYHISELLQYKESALVVVAANKKYHEEIDVILKEYGFEKRLFLDVKI